MPAQAQGHGVSVDLHLGRQVRLRNRPANYELPCERLFREKRPELRRGLENRLRPGHAQRDPVGALKPRLPPKPLDVAALYAMLAEVAQNLSTIEK